jgi:hypothetical protein
MCTRWVPQLGRWLVLEALPRFFVSEMSSGTSLLASASRLH